MDSGFIVFVVSFVLSGGWLLGVSLKEFDAIGAGYLFGYVLVLFCVLLDSKGVG